MSFVSDYIDAVQRLAGEVNRDLAGKSLEERMAEAMKRNGGSMNPLWVREALIREPASDSPSGGEKP